jgi:hypothetical protein
MNRLPVAPGMSPNSPSLFAAIHKGTDGLIAEISTVPEPGSLTLIAIGASSGLAVRWWRRKPKRG